MPKFLFKANDDVLSHCNCVDPPATSSGQMDCPWCGCGWMIACAKCGKAFTFAVVRETDTPLVEYGRREVELRGLRNHVTDTEIGEWAEAWAETMDEFEVGDIVVYLDGSYFAVGETGIEFEGYFASHKFDVLPHALAMKDPPLLGRTLGEAKYWFDRELPDRE